MSARRQRSRQSRRASPPAAAARPSASAAVSDRVVQASIVFVCLLAVTLFAYQPAWHGTLLWDDAQHLTPAHLRPVSGLSQIWFTVGTTQQYYPVTHSAFWLQHRLWGDTTLGYHLVNILLHACSAGLLLLILRRLAIPGAAFAAFLFALHPVHAESVAWITELKNTLSGVFYFSAALAYLRFDDTRDRGAYAMALVLFALALASKTVTATLPAGLLVVVWWRRGRLDWRRDVVPLAPFLALGVAGGVVTAWVEHALIGARGSDFDFTLVERCLIAGRAVCFYLAALVWPSNLTFVYPRWQISQSVWWQYLYPLGVAALLAVCWHLRARSRAPFAAVLFFGITLAPALGFVNVYPFRFSFVADHFVYLASVSIVTLVAAALTRLVQRMPSTSAQRALLVTIVGALAVLTWQQSHLYANATTLYRATITRNPSAWLAHTNLAAELMNGTLADVQEGVAHARTALQLQPDDVEARYNLAGGLKRLGALEEAAREYQAVLTALAASPTDRPRMAGLHRSLGNVLAELGRLEEAIASYRASLSYAAASALTHTELGIALGRLGRHAEALSAFREALRLEPAVADRHTNLGGALLQLGRFDEAIVAYRAAVALAPGDANVYNDLGVALLAAGRPAEAVAQFEAALRLAPGHGPARANLGRAQASVRGR
jgi:tetratricopeptide (TPR) repeat protein